MLLWGIAIHGYSCTEVFKPLQQYFWSWPPLVMTCTL